MDVKEVTGALTGAGFSGVPDNLTEVRTIAICKESLRATDPKIAKLCRELISRTSSVDHHGPATIN